MRLQPSRWLKWLALLLVALALIAGLSKLRDNRAAQVADPQALATLSLSFGPRDYPAALALADGNVRAARDRLAQAPGQWLGHEILARALYARSRLTGSFDDLAEAVMIADAGMQLAPAGSGPVLTSAALALAGHRPDKASALAQIADGFVVLPPAADRAEVIAIKGDIAFHQGRYAAAQRHYDRSMAISPSASTAYRLAIVASRFGAPDTALQFYNDSAHLTPDRNAQLIANLLLQCGMVELARGDWDAADRLFTLADRRFPGSWLTAAHRIQLRAARGDLGAAQRGYLAILLQAGSVDRPEIMDALALVYRAQGDMPNARLWADRAGSIWQRRMAMLPDAVAGHYAEHMLVFGKPGEALALAERAYRRRPTGDQAVLLAAAQIGQGQARRAAYLLEAQVLKGWRTAALYREQETAWALIGAGDKAQQARAAALVLNPKALDGGFAMIRFGHY